MLKPLTMSYKTTALLLTVAFWPVATLARDAAPAVKAEVQAPVEAMEDAVAETKAKPAVAPDYGMLAPGIPAVLSPADVTLYKKMFSLQRQLKRSEVAALVPNLDDRLLMGYLIAERLLHPNTVAQYADLQQWLSRYNDQAPARDIYTLANSRRPKGQTHKAPDFGAPIMAQYSDPDRVTSPRDTVRNTSTRQKLLRQLRTYRLRVMYTKAEQLLDKPNTRKILGDETFAEVGVTLARSMAGRGYYDRAESRARKVLEAIDSPQPLALWIAGFSAYQQKKYADAASTFRRLVYSVPPRSRYYARAAWWAARSYEKMERPSMARVFLSMAAHDELSFYGLLAMERMNRMQELVVRQPQIVGGEMKRLLEEPGIRRVIALAQIGENALAQNELNATYERIPYGMDETLLALSTYLKLPKASLTLAKNLRERNLVYISGLYPDIGNWKPQEGYKVDKALLLAVMRQESAFEPNARSRVGASGLMQVMPQTARHIRAMQRKPRLPNYMLTEPSVSMSLGQDYLLHLEKEFDGNLIHMIAAYNAGPGNVRKWVSRGLLKDDPIMFIETIPFTETRNYVMHVLSNLWMYQRIFYGEASTLTPLARNQWPSKKQLAKLHDTDG